MSLGVILDKLQSIFIAKFPYSIGISTTTIEVDNHNGTGMRRNGLFDELVVYLERIDIRFDKYWYKVIVRNGKDSGNKRIGRYDDLVTILHDTQFFIGTKDERQSIKPIGHTNTMLRTDILGIMFFKTTGCLTPQIPAAVQYVSDSLAYFRILEGVYF